MQTLLRLKHLLSVMDSIPQNEKNSLHHQYREKLETQIIVRSYELEGMELYELEEMEIEYYNIEDSIDITNEFK